MTFLTRFLPLFMVLATLGFSNAQASDVPYDSARANRPASQSSDVGLMFMKLGNIPPNFDELVKASKAYKEKNPMAQAEFLASEKTRLETRFGAIDPRTDILVVRAGMNSIFDRKDDGTAALKLEYPKDSILYFPYYYGGYPIAMFINGIEAFEEIALDRAEAADVALRIPPTGSITMLLELKARAVDAKKPVKLDGVRQYPLLTDIAYIGLINSKGEQVWAWQTKEQAQKTKNSLANTLNPLGQ